MTSSVTDPPPRLEKVVHWIHYPSSNSSPTTSRKSSKTRGSGGYETPPPPALFGVSPEETSAHDRQSGAETFQSVI